MAKKSLPSAADYPPLEAWLTEHNAREAWHAVAPQGAAVACYVVGTSTVIALLRPVPRGWDLYTALDTIDIAATLADAHARVTDAAPSALRGAFDRVSEDRAQLALAVDREIGSALGCEGASVEAMATAARVLAGERDGLRAEVERLRTALAEVSSVGERHVDAAAVEPEAPTAPTVVRGWRA